MNLVQSELKAEKAHEYYVKNKERIRLQHIKYRAVRSVNVEDEDGVMAAPSPSAFTGEDWGWWEQVRQDILRQVWTETLGVDAQNKFYRMLDEKVCAQY